LCTSQQGCVCVHIRYRIPQPSKDPEASTETIYRRKRTNTRFCQKLIRPSVSRPSALDPRWRQRRRTRAPPYQRSTCAPTAPRQRANTTSSSSRVKVQDGILLVAPARPRPGRPASSCCAWRPGSACRNYLRHGKPHGQPLKTAGPTIAPSAAARSPRGPLQAALHAQISAYVEGMRKFGVKHVCPICCGPLTTKLLEEASRLNTLLWLPILSLVNRRRRILNRDRTKQRS
jgi:hypothetical protein